MRYLELFLSDSEERKLDALAAARGRTPEQCLLDFIASCQPGGGGWVHPSAAAQKAKGSE